jgi:predicted GIY-YIG superfamily endonuclease
MSAAAERDGRAGTEAGTVYMVHFDTPYKHARHYTGWARDLDARLEAHREGPGARLMEVVKDAGIAWRLARTWPGTRERERAIKNRHEAPKLCPECTPQPRPVTAGRSAATAGAGHQDQAGQAAWPQREPAGQDPDRQPSPAPEFVSAPAHGTALPAVWPGRPDDTAAREQSRGYREVVDSPISSWRQAQAPRAELAGAEAEAG